VTALPPDAAGQQAAALGAAEEPATPPEPADEDGPSGVPAADDAAARLRHLDDAPVEQHVEIYEDAHRRLEEGLADLDER
jgi:hypothetical protein